jgi:hypothetical protein
MNINDQNIQTTIAGEWASWEAECVTDQHSPKQRSEMRRAFYSGVASLMAMVTTCLDPSDDLTDADLSRVESWYEELRRFGADMLAGRS